MLRGLWIVLAALTLSACTADITGLGTVTVPELTQLISSGSVVVCDANNAETRGKYGIIPGAVLLTSAKDLNVSELPADKAAKLVFYCGSEMCSAAPSAARQAKAQGYTDVNVLSVGIKGWVEAKQPVDRPEAG